MEEIDKASSKFTALHEEIKSLKDKIHTEEDTKFQIISRVLVEILGWPHDSISCEQKHDNGFSDYLVSYQGANTFVLEAKKLGKLDIQVSDRSKRQHLKISGPSLKSCLEGIHQGASYALPNGMRFCILTDGEAWIFYLTYVDGHAFTDKQAIVFPSLEAVENNFALFFNLGSKLGVGDKYYTRKFDEIHQNRSAAERKLYSPYNPDKIKIVQKDKISYDLDKIFSEFFSHIRGSSNEEMLVECFVESRESRIADFALEKITTSVMGNIAPREQDVNQELTTLIRGNVEEKKSDFNFRKTIFIVGPTGSGKSTFLERFFEKTLPRGIARKCIIINLECLDASGNIETIESWLTERIIDAIEKNNFEDSAPSWNQLKGMYHKEYARQIKGQHKHLYEENKKQFDIKFGDFIADEVEKNRESYLNRLLSDTIVNRKKLPIIVLDNADEFGILVKKRIFQFINSIQRSAKHCLAIFSMTDKSAWAFSKLDIYSIHKSKSFFLPTPSPREVFRKRIDYLRKKVTPSNEIKSAKFLDNRGITISIEDMDYFAKILEEVFVEHDYSAKLLGELSNYNIRIALSLAQRIVTSAVFDISDLLKSYIAGTPISAGTPKLIHALLKGDYEHYVRGKGSNVFPIFQVGSALDYSPLLPLRILALLKATRENNRNTDDQHLTVDSIHNFFEGIGATEHSIDAVIKNLLEYKLVEPFDVSNTSISLGQRLAISAKGLVHLRLACSHFVFFEQMALTTGMVTEETSDQIRGVYLSKTSFKEKLEKIRIIFGTYLFEQDKKFMSQEVVTEGYSSQGNLLKDLSQQFTKGQPFQTNNQKNVRTNVRAIVSRFFEDKGFGFADAIEGNEEFFFHIKEFIAIGHPDLYEGEVFECDVCELEKGPAVTKVHKVEPISVEEISCVIVRLRNDRSYGFVNLANSDRDAFFHYSLLSKNEAQALEVGMEIFAEVVPDPKIDGWQVKKILEIEGRKLDEPKHIKI